jgi:hypothetical protein
MAVEEHRETYIVRLYRLILILGSTVASNYLQNLFESWAFVVGQVGTSGQRVVNTGEGPEMGI